jgi:hypothetical protein
MRCDRICVMEGGRFAEIGSHRELVAKRGIYYGFWKEQIADGGDAPGVELGLGAESGRERGEHGHEYASSPKSRGAAEPPRLIANAAIFSPHLFAAGGGVGVGVDAGRGGAPPGVAAGADAGRNEGMPYAIAAGAGSEDGDARRAVVAAAAGQEGGEAP